MSKPSIIRVLEHYGSDENLAETSSWRSVRCPFHEDRNSSARYISDGENEAFHCNTGCASGDSISVVQDKEGLDYKGALEFLEQLTGEQLTSGHGERPARYKPVRLGDTSSPSAPAPAARKRRRKRRLNDN